MKKKMLLLLPIAMIMAGCTWWNPLTWFQKEDKKSEEPGDVDPEDMETDAKTISASPSAPFFLKVGEEKQVSVSLSPNPKDAYKKKFTWSLKGNHISYVVSEDSEMKATITGLSAGTSYLTATNVYDKALTKTFTVKVINFDSDNQYLWQYATSDKAKFDSKDGIANLAGIEWDFVRSKEISLNPNYNAMGFGKNRDPETQLDFVAYNSRPISSLTIEAASANSLGKMTVKIGNEIVLDEVTVKKADYDHNLSFYSWENNTPLTGNVSIHVDTPEYDSSTDVDEQSYKGPGAFLIKSIAITYSGEPEYQSESDFDFVGMYTDPNSDLYKDKLNKTSGSSPGKNFTLTEGSVTTIVNNVFKEADDAKTPGYPHLNGDIYITADEGEVLKKVELKLAVAEGAEVANKYVLETTRSGGAIYSSSDVTVDAHSGLLKFYIYGDHISQVRLKSTGNYVGIDYLNVKTQLGSHGVVDKIEVPEDYLPKKIEYYAGEYFDTTGLPVARIAYTDPTIQKDVVKPSDMEWFDGVSYENDPSTATRVLAAGTTCVYGVLRADLTVKVEGLSVISDDINLSIVKDLADIDSTSHYFIICKSKHNLMLSSKGSDMGKTSPGGVNPLEGITIEDEMSISKGFINDYYTFSLQGDDLYQIQGSLGNYFSMTANGGLSTSDKPKPEGQKNFTLSIDSSGIATFHYTISATSIEGYLYFASANIGMKSTLTANLSIYKLVD